MIKRSPFSVAFTGRSGRPVLRNVANRRPGPRTLPPTRDPEPIALDREPETTLYSPLTFEVGRQQIAQWTGSFFVGNLLFARHEGAIYSARRVVSARRSGRGVVMTLSTSDPTGRRLVVRISPDRGAAMRVRATATPRTGVINIADSFRAGRNEAFHGFGGRHNAIDQRTGELSSWVNEENFGGGAIRGTAQVPTLIATGTAFTAQQLGINDVELADLPGGPDRYMFPNGPGAAYYPQAQFISSRPYGFLVANPELARWRLAADRPDAWQVSISASSLDYTVAIGRAPKAIDTLTAITGRHRLPPSWSQGPTLWRAVQVGSETPASYLAKLRRDVADIERLRPPLKAYAFEGWGFLDPTAVREVIARLRRQGIRTILYVRAFVSNDGTLGNEPNDFEQAVARGLVTRRADGSPYVSRPFGPPTALLDFTNPDTARFWEDRIRRMLDLGADGFMQDFGEQALLDMRFASGESGARMHNRFPIIFHRLTRRIVSRYERRHPSRGPIFFLTRSGYSGRPGAAAYETSNFPGDETTDWSHGTGLASLASDMLNRGVGGAFGFNTDIGGYADFFDGPPSKELFLRWSQWSALTPFFRVHNSASTGTRTPWSYDPKTLRLWRDAAALHQRALPYMRRLWRAAERSGIPITRPLWLAFPGDKRAAEQDQQWMLGPDVLVAPVVQRGATSRRVYVPAGCWRDPQTGRRLRGRAFHSVAAPLDHLPYLFRCGKRPF